jgi:hypothetical protein
VYWFYDPNDAGAPHPLEFDPQTATFSCGKLLYFPGGEASVRPCHVNFFE